MVASQHYRYLLRELVNIADGSRRNSNADMVKVVKPYSSAELEAVADYMSRLPPPARQ
jgi:cytochrome c553